MLIHKVALENYGLYRGVVEFDLSPRTKYGATRPVVLLGGKNGAGKTTLLDAIRLVFYGKASLGPRITNDRYRDYLSSLIHRAEELTLQPTYARAGISFSYVKNGTTDEFYVERSWQLDGRSGIGEFLKIIRNGEPLQNVTDEYWQGFIEDIIPERLSQLFFFDGEKIKKIAEDETGNLALADSIKSLLGLDLVEKLKADLAVYSARVAKQTAAPEDAARIADLERKITEKESRLEVGKQNLAGLKARLDQAAAEKRAYEIELSREGKYFARERSSLEHDAKALEIEIDHLKQAIRTESELTYPFALCPSITELLKNQIETERANFRKQMIGEEISKIRQELLTSLPPVFRDLGLDDWAKLEGEISKTFDRFAGDTERGSTSNYLKLSENEALQLVQWINNAATDSSATMISLCEELDKKIHFRDETEKKIAMAPDDDLLSSIYAKLTEASRKIGGLEEEARQSASEISGVENELSALQREYVKLISKQEGLKASEERLSLARRTRSALDAYLELLTRKKIDHLRKTVADCFNFLCRKGEVLKEIDIDPTTFNVTLYDLNGNAMPNESLSQGEKQIYAISILWGLAKTSGRPLPVIIDTPLARLDSDHRIALVTKYFPNASHQVILLSTDTEVEKELFRELGPNISHCYHLEYDNKLKATGITEGYFWKEELAHA